MPQLNERLLDNEQVNNLKQLFNEGFKDFVHTYFQNFEAKEKEILTAITENKLDNVVKIAHSLKGSSLNMGALGLANVCYQLEMASKRGNLEEVTQEFKELQLIYPKTKEAFLQHTQ